MVFAFDSRNRLTQAGSMVYRYDAENQRIGVGQNQFVVNSQPNLSQVLVKTEADGKKTFYVYGLGLIGEETGSEYTSYHFDLRGSTVALTNGTGQVTERFQYSPYGVLLNGNAEKTPFLFNGMYGVMTDGNGLYYMRARFYSPEMRRFVNQDILLGGIGDGQTLNRYAYVTGRPVSFVDPFGLVGENVVSTVCGVALIEPTPVGELGCLCGLTALGIIVYSTSSSIPTPRASGFVAPGEGIQWPGDCDGDYLNYLQDQKDLLCNMPRRCHKRNETCPSVEAKMLAGYQCKAIRIQIMNECFRGGDEKHRKELQKVDEVLAQCGEIALKVCMPVND